jgi:DNA-binding GntR family transcriptional regulator
VVGDANVRTARSRAAGGRSDGRLENRTLWERVYLHLREEIVSNRLGPGTDLAEVALAESLGVSRGPIREALGRLATEGLVTVRPRRGAVVTPLSKAEFLDAYQVREALETLAVRLAVPRLSADQRRSLQGLVTEMAECEARDDVTGFFRANARFHGTFVEASGNRRLQDLYRQLLAQLARYQTPSLELRGSLRRSIAEHRAILRAVERHDAERAAHLVSEHIRVPQRRLASASEEDLLGSERTGAKAGHA